MRRIARHLLRLLTAVIAAAALLTVAPAVGQPVVVRYDRAALDAMLAPIALYPDALLSHVLMAATYPEEIDEAATWLRARPGLSGDAAVRTSADQDWDPSVRSLVAFPMVLETLAAHPRWTADLGNAFLAQRADVMDSVQSLRRRAYETGALRSNEAVRVVVTTAGIVVEQTLPETVHIPYYDPRVAYGGWWWPSHPPMYWPRWYGYADPLARGRYLAWGPGVYVGSGLFFGNFVWPRHEVRVVQTHPHYYPSRVLATRQVVPGPAVPRDVRPGVWRHDDWRRSPERDWRRDDATRSPLATRSVTESRELRRNDARERHGSDRQGDASPGRQSDRERIGAPDRTRRDPDRTGNGRPDRDRGAIDRDRNSAPDRRIGPSELRSNERPGPREQWRSPRTDRDDARSPAPREAPRAAARAERNPPAGRHAELEREFRRPARARTDPGNRD